MTSLRRSLAVVAVLGLAAAGCDEWNDRGSLPLSAVQPTSPPAGNEIRPVEPADAGTPSDPTPPADAGTVDPTPTPGSYDAMCRNYCGALERTLIYTCIGRGQGDAVACAARFGGTESQCWELRCVPRLVQQSLCFTQCDALATAYGSACAPNISTSGSQYVCATPVAAHDAACRAGCALDPSLPGS